MQWQSQSSLGNLCGFIKACNCSTTYTLSLISDITKTRNNGNELYNKNTQAKIGCFYRFVAECNSCNMVDKSGNHLGNYCQIIKS